MNGERFINLHLADNILLTPNHSLLPKVKSKVMKYRKFSIVRYTSKHIGLLRNYSKTNDNFFLRKDLNI